MEVQKKAVTGEDGLVDRLLDREAGMGDLRIIADQFGFVRSENHPRKLRLDSLGRLYVDPETDEIFRPGDGGHGNSLAVT